MENNNELKDIDVKNCMCYYFDDIIIEDFDLDNILKDKKLYEIIFIYEILNKSLIVPKPLRVRFSTVDGFIRVYDATIYLASFGSKKNDAI